MRSGLVPVMSTALREAGSRFLIHADDEPKLRKPGPKSGDASPINAVREMWRPSFWRFFGGMARAGGAKPTKIEGAETFANGEQLDVPGRPRVVATPGHTAGHCAFAFEDHGVLFIGDELCTWNPLTGKLGPQVMPTVFNVSTDQCFESLAAVEQTGIRVLLPGHGEPWWEGAAGAVEHARGVGRT